MTAITPEIVREHGLSPDEYARIKRLLNREPNLTPEEHKKILEFLKSGG